MLDHLPICVYIVVYQSTSSNLTSSCIYIYIYQYMYIYIHIHRIIHPYKYPYIYIYILIILTIIVIIIIIIYMSVYPSIHSQTLPLNPTLPTLPYRTPHLASTMNSGLLGLLVKKVAVGTVPYLRPKVQGYVRGYIAGWWLGHPSEKYDFVNWDDDIPNIWENKKRQPNHQPGIYRIYLQQKRPEIWDLVDLV